MSLVTVFAFANVKRIIGEKKIFVRAQSVQDLLNNLFDEYGITLKRELLNEEGDLKSYYHIIVNGRNISLLKGVKTALKDEDMVAIIPAIAGG